MRSTVHRMPKHRIKNGAMLALFVGLASLLILNHNNLISRIGKIAIFKSAMIESSFAADAKEADGDYEIDYEEEPEEGAAADAAADTAEEPEKPAPKKKSAKGKKSIGGGPAVQGSRAKNRFTAILKSDTKSAYKKNGKPLDVDAD